MPLVMRLLTFDQLPNRQLIGDLAPLTEVYERLDSTTAFFENYYLQSTGVHSLVGLPDTLSGVKAGLVERSLSAQFVSAGSLSNSTVGGAVPDWFDKQTIDHRHSDFSLPDDCAVVWMHCCLAMQPGSADADAAKIGECLDVMRTLALECNSPLIVTGLNGADVPAEFPFESKLFEGLIRVPLWVESSGGECSRVQDVAGSFDVMQTARQLIQPEVAEQAFTTERFQPTNLITLIANSGLSAGRELSIQTANANAIRSESFLFVQSNDAAKVGDVSFADCALYSKPADVWNVHNVSAEYHEIVNEFSQQIQPRTN